MSHHLDSELARQDPRLDISDTYVFRGTMGTAFVVNVNPVSGPGGFHPEGGYELKIDADGDAVENTTYRFTFGETGSDGRQAWHLSRVDGDAATDPLAGGEPLLDGTTDPSGVDPTAVATGEGIRAWVGTAADPFWIEGTVVTAVRTAIAEGRPVRLEDFDPADATNVFAGTDVNAIVLEIADTVMPAPLIGFWAATVLPTDAGGRRQINRCAQPLVNTLFALEDAERDVDFNATQPREDRERYGDIVVRDTTAVVAAMGTVPDPKTHAEALRDTLFPDVLWYEVGTEAHFATARRNGRGLTTNTPEVMFELVLGTPVSLGLDATAAGTCRPEFPYVPAPTAKPA